MYQAGLDRTLGGWGLSKPPSNFSNAMRLLTILYRLQLELSAQAEHAACVVCQLRTRRVPAACRFASAMKYVLVSGGVVSGLGKGVTASSIGVILKNCGHRVTSVKIGEPYRFTSDL